MADRQIDRNIQTETYRERESDRQIDRIIQTETYRERVRQTDR